MAKRKIVFIIGTRPDAIKMVSVIKKFETSPSYSTVIISTSQHKDLLIEVIDLFDIKVDYNLNIMQPNQTLTGLSSGLMTGLQQIYNKVKPDLVFVQGDTSSSFIGALTAFYNRIPVAHIEAGLRTHDKFSPYPEESNRFFIDYLSDYLFPPTESAVENLKQLNIPTCRIRVTGNTGIDALLMVLKLGPELKNSMLELVLEKDFILLTTHRRENFGEPLNNIIRSVKELSVRFPEIPFLIPVHPNPHVKIRLENELGSIPEFILVDPLNYSDFITVMSKARLIITDSGGVQEEAPVLGTPVVVLREKSERMEAVKAGASVLTGTDQHTIVETVTKILQDEEIYKRMSKERFIFGDGNAGEEIFSFISGKIQ